MRTKVWAKTFHESVCPKVQEIKKIPTFEQSKIIFHRQQKRLATSHKRARKTSMMLWRRRAGLQYAYGMALQPTKPFPTASWCAWEKKVSRPFDRI
jgi:hypothetical protein